MFNNFDMNAPLGEKFAFAIQVAIFGVLIVFALLVLLAVCIMIISRIVRAAEGVASKKKGLPDEAEAPALGKASGTPLPDTQSAGKLELVDVDEPTAAVIMAIVSDQSGIPLNRLLFKSIKQVD